jgi:hypothetical protein
LSKVECLSQPVSKPHMPSMLLLTVGLDMADELRLLDQRI